MNSGAKMVPLVPIVAEHPEYQRDFWPDNGDKAVWLEEGAIESDNIKIYKTLVLAQSKILFYPQGKTHGSP